MPNANDTPVILTETKHLRLLSLDGWIFVQRMRMSGVVAIVPITRDDQLVLIEQYRPPLGKRIVEFPAGLVGDQPGSEDESHEQAAHRELLEETGFQADHLDRLFETPTSPGLTDEQLTFFLARDVVRVGPGGGDASEQIIVHTVPLTRIQAWLGEQTAEGKLIDIKVYAGLYGITSFAV